MAQSVFDQMPKVMGHRGACGLAPENTLASIQKAADLGTKFIEIDVCLTQDNVPIIHHDMNVRRCTDGEGPVLLKSLDEIKALDAGSWFSDDFRGERIPTLQEALALISKLGLGLNLEIKPTMGWQLPTAEQVAHELIADLPENMPLLFSSFSEETLRSTSATLPDVPRGYLTEAVPLDWERRLRDTGCASLHCQKEFVTAENVAAVKAAGYKYLVYTVNNVAMAQKFLDWGVDSIITDFPDRMFAGLKLDEKAVTSA
ncbi:MAG: glycerophosphoryl diester phosphodiesterase [Proteobacteria bacterium]|nr:glycerophosphoryl diester phosphodiesterase [Pseudomonadota bacterium]